MYEAFFIIMAGMLFIRLVRVRCAKLRFLEGGGCKDLCVHVSRLMTFLIKMVGQVEIEVYSIELGGGLNRRWGEVLRQLGRSPAVPVLCSKVVESYITLTLMR